MRLLTIVSLLATTNAALHINKTLEAASMWGAIGLDEQGHMYVKGQYIVVFKRETTLTEASRHLSFVAPELIQHRYNGATFKGYAATLDDGLLAKVSSQPEVAYVTPNHIAWALGEDCDTMHMESDVWGTIRTNNIPLVTTGNYYENPGAGDDVHSYVIDTGVFIEHAAFGGRAHHGVDYTGEGNGDGHGHGTHVGGTMIGRGYGIAQEGHTTAVKVLNSQGSGTYANVIAGILWTADDAASDKKGKGVANLSLGGGYSQAVTDAIEDVFQRGIICVVAAGNNNGDACLLSPAGAPHSITVGASTITDARASFSAWGCCVDMHAPGQNIKSTVPGGSGNEWAVYSGTSMAAPHIAGMIQYFWSVQPDEPTQKIKDDILAAANPDKLTGGTFSGTCSSAHANCRRPGAACEPPATGWSNNLLGYQRCII